MAAPLSHLFGLSILGAAATAGSPPDNTIKVAIISSLSVLLAAAITGFASTYQKHRATETVEAAETRTEIELRRRAERAEATLRLREKVIERRDERIDQLENYCIDHGINPHTGQRVVIS